MRDVEGEGKALLPRDRVFAALDFKAPDIIPLEYHPSPRGFYEHGEKLRELFLKNIGDFGDIVSTPIPVPDKKNFDENGDYHEFKYDDWGTLWEYRIFGLMGHPLKWPLENINDIKGFKPPAQTIPAIGSPRHLELESTIAEHKKRYFYKGGWIGILEKLQSLRRFEDVLMDIAMDTPEINILADIITEYHAEDIRRLIAAGVDAVQFGDDYGTQTSLLLSPGNWRRFFKPRLSRLMKPLLDAGIKICFHSCGHVHEILDDLKEIGADSVWPQMAVYNGRELATHCRDIGLAVAIHIDRSNTMAFGSPEDVKRAIDSAVESFRPQNGGSWFYVEIDQGFPFENIEALLSSISRYR